MAWTRLRKDISPTTLRGEAKKEKNAGVCRRLLGIAHIVEGGRRCDAQKIAGLTVNTFRIWMKRFNEQGIRGLRSKKSPGRPIKVTREIEEKLKEKIISGPSPEERLVRYRLSDLQKFLKEDHQISMSLSGIWYILRDLNMTWKTGRQRHPKSDVEIQEAFKKTSHKNF